MAIETLSRPNQLDQSKNSRTELNRAILESGFESTQNKKEQIKQILRAVHTLNTSMGSNAVEQASFMKNPGTWAGNMLKSVVGARWVSSFVDRSLNLNDLPDQGGKSPIAKGIKNLTNGIRNALSTDTADYFADFSEQVTNGFGTEDEGRLKDNILQKIVGDLSKKAQKRKFAGIEFRAKIVTGDNAKLLNTLMQFSGIRNTDAILDLVHDYQKNGSNAKLEKIVNSIYDQIQKVTRLAEMSEMAGSELGNNLLQNVAGSVSSTGIHVSDMRSSGLMTWVNMVTRGVPGLNIIKMGSTLGFALEGTVNAKQDTNKVLNTLVQNERPKIIESLKSQIPGFDEMPQDSQEFLIAKKMMPVIAQYASQQAAQDRELTEKKETLLGQTKQFFLKSLGLKKGFKNISDSFKGEVNGISNLQGLLAFTNSYSDRISEFSKTISPEEFERLLDIDGEINYQPNLDNLSSEINESIGKMGVRDIPSLLKQMAIQSLSTVASGSALKVLGGAAVNVKTAVTGEGQFQTFETIGTGITRDIQANANFVSKFGNYVSGFRGESANAQPLGVINPPSTAPYENQSQSGVVETPSNIPQSTPIDTEAGNGLSVAETATESAVIAPVQKSVINLGTVKDVNTAFESGKLEVGSKYTIDGKTYQIVGDENGQVNYESTVRELTKRVNAVNQQKNQSPTEVGANQIIEPGERVVNLNSEKDIESAVAYGAVTTGDIVLVNGYKVKIQGNRDGAITTDTITYLNQFLEKEPGGSTVIENPQLRQIVESEPVQSVAQSIGKLFESTGITEVAEQTTKTVETIIPLTPNNKFSLVKIELPTSFNGELTHSDVGDPEQIPLSATVISDDVDGAIFYEYQKDGKSIIRVALVGDTPGTAREIMNPNITFELTTQDGVKLDPAVSSEVLHGGLDERQVYDSVAAADPQNSKYFLVENGNDLTPANDVEVAPGVDLRTLVTNADEFTASYGNQYKAGTTAFINMILAGDNETRNQYIDGLAADRRHILDNPGEQAGFPRKYRDTLIELEELGVFTEGFNGQDLNNVAREVQLDSGTTFITNELNNQRVLILQSLSQIRKYLGTTEYNSSRRVNLDQEWLHRNGYPEINNAIRMAALARTPEEIIAANNEMTRLMKRISKMNLDFTGTQKIAYREMRSRVDEQSAKFEQQLPFMNAYIEATGGTDTIVRGENGLVQGVELEEFNSSIGLNLPDVSTPGGAIQALSMAWGITKGQIPIPLKFKQSGSIKFGTLTPAQKDALLDPNNLSFKESRSGISPQAQSILAPILNGFGVPFIMTGKTIRSSGTASDIEIVIPKELINQEELADMVVAAENLAVEQRENGVFLLEDLIKNHSDILDKLQSGEGLDVSDIRGVVKDRDGNLLEGEQLDSYVKAMNTYYVVFEKTRQHARAGEVGVIESLEVAMQNPEVLAGIRKELGENEFKQVLNSGSDEFTKSLEDERARLNSMIDGTNAQVDGSIFLQAAGVDKVTADQITIALKNGDYNTLAKYQVIEEVIDSQRGGTYYTNPGGYTPDSGHELGMNHVIYQPGFKMVTLEINGQKFRFDPVCGNYVRFWDQPSPSKPDVCLTGEVCVGKIYEANAADSDIARTKQTVEELTRIDGDITDMARSNLGLDVANQNAQKGTIPYLRDMVINAPEGESLDNYIAENGLDRISFGEGDFTIADIVRESKTNPDVKAFWDKVVASDKINAALVEHNSTGTFTLTIGLPKTTEISTSQVIDGGPQQVTSTTETLSNGAIKTVTKTVTPGDTTVTDTFSTTTSNNKVDATFDSKFTAIIGATSFAEFIDKCKVANLSNESAGIYEEEISTRAGAKIDLKSDSHERQVDREEDVITEETEITEPPEPEPPVEPPQPEPEPELTEETNPTQPTPTAEQPGQPGDGPENTEAVEPNEPTPPGEQPPQPDGNPEPTETTDPTQPTPPGERPPGPDGRPEPTDGTDVNEPTPPGQQPPQSGPGPSPTDTVDPTKPVPPSQPPVASPDSPSPQVPTEPETPTPPGTPPVSPETPNPSPAPETPTPPTPPAQPPSIPDAPNPNPTTDTPPSPVPPSTPPSTPDVPTTPEPPVADAPTIDTNVPAPTPPSSQPSDSIIETGGPGQTDFGTGGNVDIGGSPVSNPAPVPAPTPNIPPSAPSPQPPAPSPTPVTPAPAPQPVAPAPLPTPPPSAPAPIPAPQPTPVAPPQTPVVEEFNPGFANPDSPQ